MWLKPTPWFAIGLVAVIAGEALRSIPNALILGGSICVGIGLFIAVALMSTKINRNE